jgi:hypothetical protein
LVDAGLDRLARFLLHPSLERSRVVRNRFCVTVLFATFVAAETDPRFPNDYLSDTMDHDTDRLGDRLLCCVDADRRLVSPFGEINSQDRRGRHVQLAAHEAALGSRFLFQNLLNMSDDSSPQDENDVKESFDVIADGSDPGILREFVWFLRYNKKWWLTPIVVVLLLLVALAFVTTSPAAPFIYTLF